jgi:hypothetical protein
MVQNTLAETHMGSMEEKLKLGSQVYTVSYTFNKFNKKTGQNKCVLGMTIWRECFNNNILSSLLQELAFIGSLTLL